MYRDNRDPMLASSPEDPSDSGPVRRIAVMRIAAAVATALFALTGCGDDRQQEGEISQAARDGYQDKRLDAIEERLDQLEAHQRRDLSRGPAPPAPAPALEEVGTEVEPLAAASEPTPEAMAVQLLDASARAVERNKSWWRFSWKAIVRNNLDRAIDVTVTIQFLDVDGYVVSKDSKAVHLRAGEETEVTDFDLIDTEVAPRVAKVKGSLSL